MTTIALSSTPTGDAELVQQSLAGNRQAFGEIVSRYQALVCALAYSATGNRSHSEDLAQETFVTAWRQMSELREPDRLRAWLCGIARNIIHGDLRRLGRQPAHAATSLDAAAEFASAEPQPSADAVSKEEMAILWREVGRLPEIYREPLILYYREHQSVKLVAEALDLSPETVMQRLTRGRRQLQERMLEFVESTLRRTGPGSRFTLQVQSALPAIAGAGPGAAVAATAKGGAAAHTGALGIFIAWAAPLVGVFAAIGMCWSEIVHAPTKRERRFVSLWTLVLWISLAAMIAALFHTSVLARWFGMDSPQGEMTVRVAIWFSFTLIAVTLIVLLIRGKAALRRRLIAEGHVDPHARVPVTAKSALAQLFGFLISLFWTPIFLAWTTGDRAVALGISIGLLGLAAIPFLYSRNRYQEVNQPQSGGAFVVCCGLIFVALLNWRLDLWMARMAGMDLAAMHQLLPMSTIHWLSAIVIGWTAALLLLTRPKKS